MGKPVRGRSSRVAFVAIAEDQLAGIADAVAVAVGLVRVRGERAVVPASAAVLVRYAVVVVVRIASVTEAVAVDTARMADDADGPARHYLRTSWETDHELDELYGAVLRLAQASWQPAVEALEATHAGWMALIRKDVGDRHAAEAIMLIGEGLYHQSLMPGTWSRELFRDSLDHLLDLVDRLKENR